MAAEIDRPPSTVSKTHLSAQRKSRLGKMSKTLVADPRPNPPVTEVAGLKHQCPMAVAQAKRPTKVLTFGVDGMIAGSQKMLRPLKPMNSGHWPKFIGQESRRPPGHLVAPRLETRN